MHYGLVDLLVELVVAVVLFFHSGESHEACKDGTQVKSEGVHSSCSRGS